MHLSHDPNSSLAINSAGSAAQLTFTSARSERGERRWIACAINSFPVPVSPVINTGGQLAQLELAAELPLVWVDRVQLHQEMMTLMLNGIESMQATGGELTISTQREDRQALVSVSDTGVGIPADKLDEIFNSFFTTKAGGTGMGLSISRSIIESHGGHLWGD